ncbi:50S ribosomal protein L28 [Helcobacillus sp. ACRRO]|uniref:50S ribosomal protein L28 n=1 Tax=Helcobacillus TaxID=1161125 RepID=UPI001EF4B95C|nr:MULTISPECIES: 50S ribosomal protein L28 [Helcobacillus]MCG7427018.1 50S ribosomal protein L28 [Helcobacillus sp. ACRRO]MDK7742697.1 50S ribosomal protein L28 [Helcobacillus massiliensis]WOO93020.1 50S ribosomal protein L28 [Helcobacillus massiliensis]
MTTYCQITGKRPTSGRRVSHSGKRTARTFRPNLQTKMFYVPSLGRRVTLTVSAVGLKTINRRGIDSVARDLIARGEKI